MGSTVRGFSHTTVGRLLVKLSALLCAFAFWVYADSVSTDKRTLHAPVFVQRENGSLLNVTSGPVVLSHWMVEVTLGGPIEKLKALGPGSLACRLRVPDNYKGEPITLPVDRASLSMPDSSGLTILRISPDTVALSARSKSGPAMGAPKY